MKLTLETRGCNFHKDSLLNEISDIGNHRVCTTDYVIHGKDGNLYFAEFSVWDVYHVRYTHKRTGQPLKHPKRELVKYGALHANFSYTDENGYTWGCPQLSRNLFDDPQPYTKERILNQVNLISADHYDEIELKEMC